MVTRAWVIPFQTLCNNGFSVFCAILVHRADWGAVSANHGLVSDIGFGRGSK